MFIFFPLWYHSEKMAFERLAFLHLESRLWGGYLLGCLSSSTQQLEELANILIYKIKNSQKRAHLSFKHFGSFL